MEALFFVEDYRGHALWLPPNVTGPHISFRGNPRGPQTDGIRPSGWPKWRCASDERHATFESGLAETV